MLSINKTVKTQMSFEHDDTYISVATSQINLLINSAMSRQLAMKNMF